jgi:transcriptional regulator with XRE-family HTH domain
MNIKPVLTPYSMDEILIKWRLAQGHSQLEAADILGVSQSTLHNWESKKTIPRLKYLPKIAQVCQVDFVALIPKDMTLELHAPSIPDREIVNALELYKKLNLAQDEIIAALRTQVEQLQLIIDKLKR